MQHLHLLERRQNFSPMDNVTAVPPLVSAQYSPCLTNTLETRQVQVFSSWDSGQLVTMKPEQKARYATSKNKNYFSFDCFITIVWNVNYFIGWQIYKRSNEFKNCIATIHKIIDQVTQAFSVFWLRLTMNLIQPVEPHGFSLRTLHRVSQRRDSI